MLVYKQYDQAALDGQYNNRLHVPDFAIYLERWKLLSSQTAKTYHIIKDLPYGLLVREQMDIYPSVHPSSKTLIFIHGGYWHKLGKEYFQFIAEAFHVYGVTTILINYPLAPAVSMDQIVASCRQAVCWVSKNISAFNGDPDQVYIAGYSAGGHLAAMLMTTDWTRFNLSPGFIKGVCTVSGLFNLIPIGLSDINLVLGMDEDTCSSEQPGSFDTCKAM